MANLELSIKYKCIWITGLSASGKTTLAEILASKLRAQGLPVVLLDGDALREVFVTRTDKYVCHGRPYRLILAMQYARLCQIIASQGITVVIATISLFREVHQWNRANIPGYFEAYLNVPLEELRKRDPNGLYKRYDSGEIRNIAGLDLDVDVPEFPNWVASFSPEHDVSFLGNDLFDALSGRR